MIKKYFTLFFFVVFLSSIVTGQHIFFKTYETPFINRENSIIESQEGDYYVTLNEIDQSKDERQGSVYKFNSEGILQNWRSFNGQNGGTIKYIIQSKTNIGHYLIGGGRDSTTAEGTYRAPFISIIDNDLNIIYEYLYEPFLADSYVINKLIMPSDSIVYCLVEIRQGNTQIFYVDKINILYNIKHRYEPAFINDFAYCFDMMYDYQMNQLSIFYSGGTAKIITPNNRILELTDNLEYVSCDTLFNYLSYYTNGQFISDSNYILASNGHSLTSQPFHVKYSMYVFKMNKNNDSITGCIYLPEHPDDSVVYSFFIDNLAINNEKIVVGSVYNIQILNYPYWQQSPSYIQLSFFDYDINMQKQIYYGNGTDVYWPMSIQPTMDGGFVICGAWRKPEITNPPNQDLFLLKVNSEGLITGMDEPQGISASEAVVYPNPGGQRFKVKLAMQHQNALLEMFSMNGKLVLRKEINQQQTEINTQTLPQGCYTYRITAEGKKIAGGKWVKE